MQLVKQKIFIKLFYFKFNFYQFIFFILPTDDSDCDSNEENDTFAEEKLGTLNLDGWTNFVGTSEDIAKIFNMRLCLTLAYREFLKNKMISQHSVIICFLLFILF